MLAVDIAPQGRLAKVTAQEITFAPATRAPVHTHPCPVVGTVASGEIAYQLEGGPVQKLVAGMAFYEPANTKVLRFDNAGSGEARFTAFYLCESAQGALTHVLPAGRD